ncbi:MAG TPA: hypothetical protein VL547_22405 [Dinghuibacter sp.]|uniref:hypothetical protein n=1 Tax=Dinghuibacter sp. TaxID=2024697 RepID=UPI002B7D1D42|nr:hypothetical protein [Dinghuibacter sp.]HTJ14814.1 hypothetical protein [Dinghuibacter sp.]
MAKIHLYAVNPWRYISFLAVLTYLIECLIFLLKGWSLSLKERQKGLWMLLWGICFLYCFALPLLIARSMIFYGFKPAPHHPVDTLNLISWIAGALLGWLVYRRYRLNVDSAPKLMKWSYLLGRRASA